MKHILKKGVSLPEVIGIFAMLGVLCVTIAPHVINVREASQLSRLRFNLQKLRKRIDDYRNRHGQPPKNLEQAFADATEALPVSPVSNSVEGRRNRVKRIDSDPPLEDHFTNSGMGGWLYNPKTGGIWADNKHFASE